MKLYLPKSQGGTLKRKKVKKHPAAPKHPMSAYLFFVGEYRKKLKEAYPEKGFTEIARMLGEEWKKLDPVTKQVAPSPYSLPLTHLHTLPLSLAQSHGH